jgi:hypothetical protein
MGVWGGTYRLRHVTALLLLVTGAVLGAGGAGVANLSVATAAVTGAAANSQTFLDPAGDNKGGSPDVTTVQVSNDDAGVVEFRLTIPNRTDLGDLDFINVHLDTDQSAATGCDVEGGVGLDWTLSFHGHTAPAPDFFTLYHFTGCKATEAAQQASFVGEFDGVTSTLTLRVNRAEIERPKAFRLIVLASLGPAGPDSWDFAGDTTPWVYRIVVGDSNPPQIKALPSSGARGGTARLRYTVFDESGRTKEELTVFRGSRALAVKRTRLGARNGTRLYVQTWRVPSSVSGPLKFCVRAWDAAGNRSARSCARLTIR